MYIGDHVEAQPDKPAVIMGRSGIVTYRELDSRSTQLARMLRAAGLGVAYHAKPHVAAAARFNVRHGDLRTLLYFQGYTAADFVEPG